MYYTFKHLIFVFVLFYKGSCLDNSEETTCNEFVDKVIEAAITAYKYKIEPFRPKDLYFEFEKKIMLVPIRGKVNLTETEINGLSSLHREGDCELTAEDGTVRLLVTLGMGVLEFYSKAKVTFIKFGPTVTLYGEIGFALVHLEASYDKNSGNLPSVDDVKIYDIKGSEVKVKGLGPLNYIANKITAASVKLFKGKIRNRMENKLKEILDDKIKHHKFPENEEA